MALCGVWFCWSFRVSVEKKQEGAARSRAWHTLRPVNDHTLVFLPRRGPGAEPPGKISDVGPFLFSDSPYLFFDAPSVPLFWRMSYANPTLFCCQ